MKTTKFLFILFLLFWIRHLRKFKIKNSRIFSLCIHFCFFSIIFLNGRNINAQCIANAGNDTTFCISLGLDTFYIGGNPPVLNGVPPYNFTWECNILIENTPNIFHYTASDFLSDTTVANPYFTSFLPSNVTATFFLNIFDSIGNSCYDSVNVTFCGYTMISHIPIYINLNDSATLYSSIFVDCEPITCLWSPEYNISDIHDCEPQVWPDSSTIYTVLITNASGCQYLDICEVFVSQTNVNDNASMFYDFIIFPNPSGKTLNIKYSLPVNTKTAILNLYDNLGSIFYTNKLSLLNDYVQIDLPNNIYRYIYYMFIVDDIIYKTGKVLIIK